MSARSDHGPTVLVAALSSAFGTGLLGITEVLVATVRADDVWGQADVMQLILTIVSGVFIAIAIYVSAVVTVNTVATVVAGRTRELALARLLGATAASRRRLLAREGLVAGAIGGATGIAVGGALVVVGTRIAVGAGTLPDLAYPLLSPFAPPLAVVIALVTWLAAWVGTRRVLEVSPVAALGAAVPAGADAVGRRRGRRVFALITIVMGSAMLAAALLVGLNDPSGVLIGVVGGVVSFTGLVAGSVFVIPPVLRGVGALLGRSAAARVGAANATRSPERSSRSSIGLVIGVTLVTTFVVAGSTLGAMIRTKSEESFGTTEPVDELLGQLMAVFGVLVGYSAVIAAVGLVNALTVGVLQRTREFGLLRALGFSRAQVRSTVIAEAATVTITSIGLGLVLGVVYGWIGANSLFAWELGRLAAPVVPWWLVVGVAVGGAALTFGASIVPAGRASRLSPVVALAA
jgi:putative ABC transport system permease protein